MKRLLKFFAAATMSLLAANFAYAEGIQNSKHDFSAATWSDKEICKPCHTPHNAVETNLTGRLWAHTLSNATYVYHGGTVTGNDGSTRPEAGTGSATQADMDVATRLCLSCHDGTVALDSFMGKTGTSDGKFIGDADGQHGAATANLGNGQVANDLTNDHPVGYKAVYDENSGQNTQGTGHYRYNPRAAVVAAGLKLAISKTPVSAGTVDRSTGTAVTGNLPSVSCVTCHDVHNGGGQEVGLLRISNEGSALCLTCHNK
jgi:predicted CXXCH cytochrome family protein